ncbi:hypothetical protein Pa4123_64300 [Phytohabitans aurantiacus]|uniref:Uncharacterized protein n=1 Tax=Phytohabitans aurantiacus TaxID=3016789 RepID=A0ABQ5R2Z9_9ACTN|nr:hypothetical protein Pa4123_64300 [Phytohabitans aurantiacus]
MTGYEQILIETTPSALREHDTPTATILDTGRTHLKVQRPDGPRDAAERLSLGRGGRRRHVTR